MKKFIVSLLVCLSSLTLFAEDKGQPFQENIVSTVHEGRIDGKAFSYKAEAGNLILKDSSGKEKASIFYIAYFKDDVKDRSKRPITFCFNGGPGSSAIWLNLGFLGPKRILLEDTKFAKPPYNIGDNDFSLLDVTDLVFIDPVSTGYSKTAPGQDPKAFHGVEEDVKCVGDFVRLFVTKYERWSSPKYVTGESYGTTRAACLAGYLHDVHHMYLDGLILISSVLNYQTLDDQQKGNDLPYILFLPSYAATAWYHHKLPPDLQELDLETLLDEVEEFAATQYTIALMKGDSLNTRERQQILNKLSRYTSLDSKAIDRSNLRIDLQKFGKELLRDDYQTIGRFDGRVKGLDGDPSQDHLESEPSIELLLGPYTAAYNQYLHETLNLKQDDEYKVLANVWPWNFGKATNQYLSVGEDLKQVMIKNPTLRVFVASGYYDLATPYFAAEYTFHHLNLPKQLLPQIEMHRYEGGHMMYTNEKTLKLLKQDLKQFVQFSDF